MSFKTGNYSFKGSQVDRKFSFAGLQKALTQGIKKDIEMMEESKETIQTRSAKQDFHKIHSSSKRRAERPASDTAALDNARKIFKEMNRVADDLLKTESTEENLPYDLTQKGYLSKKRKQAHRHKR